MLPLDVYCATPPPRCHTDYLKCPHALAWGTTNLIFSVLEFGQVYTSTGEYNTAMGVIKWALDWLLKAHVKAGNSPGDNAFVGQVRETPESGWQDAAVLSSIEGGGRRAGETLELPVT